MNDIVIVDASVLLTAIIGDKRKAERQLRTILDDKTRSVSILPFTPIEFANGVRFSIRDVSIAKQALKRFSALTLPVVPIVSQDVHAIMELSYRLYTTVYDTSYHYVALIHEGLFITCDRSYYKKASRLGHIELWN